MDIFANGLRRDLPRLFPGGKVVYPGIGIFTREVDGKVFVSGRMEGLPGAQAGLLVGDEIVSADGQPFAAVESFRGKVGKPVELKIRRSREAAPVVVPVKPELIQPNEAFLTAQRQSARLIEADGKRIGYIKIWSYAGRQYQDTRRGARLRQAQGCRCGYLGSARWLGRRPAELSRHFQSARSGHDAQGP